MRYQVKGLLTLGLVVWSCSILAVSASAQITVVEGDQCTTVVQWSWLDYSGPNHGGQIIRSEVEGGIAAGSPIDVVYETGVGPTGPEPMPLTGTFVDETNEGTYYEYQLRIRIDPFLPEFATSSIVPIITPRTDPPRLVYPHDGDRIVDEQFSLVWEPAFAYDEYRLQVARDAAFEDIELNLVISATHFADPSQLIGYDEYHWRVAGHHECGWGPYTEAAKFSLRGDLPIAYAGRDTVIATRRQWTRMDGRQSHGPNGLVYQWSVVRGDDVSGICPDVRFDDAASDTAHARPVFTEWVRSVALQLEVTDPTNQQSDADTVVVTMIEDPENAFFVSTEALGPPITGTMFDPFPTLQDALAVAAARIGAGQDAPDIYMAEGSYTSTQTLQILNDVSIYGCFVVPDTIPGIPKAIWTRPPRETEYARDHATVIHGAATVFESDHVSDVTIVDGLTILASPGQAGGGYAGRGENSAGIFAFVPAPVDTLDYRLYLHRNVIYGDDGGDAFAGVDGEVPAAGTTGGSADEERGGSHGYNVRMKPGQTGLFGGDGGDASTRTYFGQIFSAASGWVEALTVGIGIAEDPEGYVESFHAVAGRDGWQFPGSGGAPGETDLDYDGAGFCGFQPWVMFAGTDGADGEDETSTPRTRNGDGGFGALGNGIITERGWLGVSGVLGEPGRGAPGGGGGGGGVRGDRTWWTPGPPPLFCLFGASGEDGGGGGAGGNGGNGGNPGLGGPAGGGSFAILAGRCMPRMIANTFGCAVAGDGGIGGSGTVGAAGGSGGQGTEGGWHWNWRFGASLGVRYGGGGDGGTGGTGGAGGGGGGGAGGSAGTIFGTAGANFWDVNNDHVALGTPGQLGPGGPGGDPGDPTNAGLPGADGYVILPANRDTVIAALIQPGGTESASVPLPPGEYDTINVDLTSPSAKALTLTIDSAEGNWFEYRDHESHWVFESWASHDPIAPDDFTLTVYCSSQAPEAVPVLVTVRWRQPGVAPDADPGPDINLVAADNLFGYRIRTDEPGPGETLVHFSAAQSTDPDGDVLEVRWFDLGVDPPRIVSHAVTDSIVLPIGWHEFLLEVEDGRGHVDRDTLTVHVEDIHPPWIVYPDTVRVAAGGYLDSTMVDLSSYGSVVDNSGWPPVVTFDPPAGTRLPFGPSFVECTVVDSSGNQATASIFVSVENGTQPVICWVADMDTTDVHVDIEVVAENLSGAPVASAFTDSVTLYAAGLASPFYTGWIDPLVYEYHTKLTNATFSTLQQGSTYQLKPVVPDDYPGTIRTAEVQVEYPTSYAIVSISEPLPLWTDETASIANSNYSQIAWSDFDRDGDPDVYLSTGSRANVLLRNDGGTFADVTTAPLALTGNAYAAMWVDVNQDLYSDLFVVNLSEPNVLLVNQGNGQFVDSTPAALAQVSTSLGATWADFDNDGDLDVLLINLTPENQLFLNDGAMGFTLAPAGALTDVGGTLHAPVGDYDCDGDMDLYLVRAGAPNRLLANDGNALFSDATPAPLDNAAVDYAAAWGDYDDDGDLDLALASRDTCRLFRNEGAGSFSRQVYPVFADLAEGSVDFKSISWFDHDLDGDLDLQLGDANDAVHLIRNDGPKGFTDVTPASWLGRTSIESMAWGDYNSDGDHDLLVGRSGGWPVELWHTVSHDSRKALRVQLHGTESNAQGIGARVHAWMDGQRLSRQVDLNSTRLGQGEIDPVFAVGRRSVVDSLIVDWPSGIHQVLRNVPTDTLLVLVEAAPANPWTDATDGAVGDLGASRGVAWQDFDDDGDCDLFLTRSNGQGDRLLRNDGAGGFVDVTAPPLSDPHASMGAVWGDYDDDGSMDLYVVGDGETNRLLHYEGGATFSDQTVSPLNDSAAGMSTQCVDFDGDGKLDYHLVKDGANRLVRNLGHGFFSELVGSDVNDAGAGVAAAWGDFDLDGLDDVYVVNDQTPNALIRNFGYSWFEAVSASPLDDAGPGRAAAWGDFDDDGDLDLYLVNDGAPNHLFRNDRSDGFVDVTAGALADAGPGADASWADVDNDGDLDLYLVNDGASNHLFRNDRAGGFVDATPSPLNDGGQGSAAAWADYDRDGDLDLYLANVDGPNRLIQNNDQSGHRWLHVRLVGTLSNSSCVGAQVRLKAGRRWQTRTVFGGRGAMAQDSPLVEFGLGVESVVDSLLVVWPRRLDRGQFHTTVMTALGVDQVVTLVEKDDAAVDVPNTPFVPDRFALRPPSPNPFNPATTVSFDLPHATRADLVVYDLRGRCVRELARDETFAPGRHSRKWDGRDELGRTVAAGVYLIRIRTRTDEAAHPVVLVK